MIRMNKNKQCTWPCGVALILLLGALLPVGSAQSAGVTKARWDQMYRAICQQGLSRVKALVRGGYPVNEFYRGPRGGYVTTPLNLATYCYGGNVGIANYLLDMGADVNAGSERGVYSPLMNALKKMRNSEQRKLVLRILRKGANVNYVSSVQFHRTPLMIAAISGDLAIVRMLIARGADRSRRSTERTGGRTAAEYAYEFGNVEVGLFLDGKDLAAFGKTLHYAAKTGKTARVRHLIARGADVNAALPRSGFTPLYFAACYKHLEITRMLFRAGAKPSAASVFGTTPLRAAILTCYRSDYEAKKSTRVALARILLDAGARADIRQKTGCGSGYTEFDWAVQEQMYGLAHYMLRKGATDTKKIRHILHKFDGYYESEIPFAEYLIGKGLKPSPTYVAKLKGRRRRCSTTGSLGRRCRAREVRRNMLIKMYMRALQPPGAVTKKKTGELEEWTVKVRAMPPTEAERAFDQRFRARDRSMDDSVLPVKL